ncbi:MAG: hypothetical protein M5U34_24260 [Chloroflexi bacterium]|nr:hypothetical protein [Chloroflexota bacterium]
MAHLVHPDVAMTTTRSLAKTAWRRWRSIYSTEALILSFAMFYLRLLGPAAAGSFATAIAAAMIFGDHRQLWPGNPAGAGSVAGS